MGGEGGRGESDELLSVAPSFGANPNSAPASGMLFGMLGSDGLLSERYQSEYQKGSKPG